MASLTSTKAGGKRKQFAHISDSIPSLLAIAGAILLLSMAMKKIGKLEPGQIAVSLLSVIALLGALVLATEHMSKNMKKMKEGADRKSVV